MLRFNYSNRSEFSATASVRRAWNVTPSPTEFKVPTRAIMVSEETTVTGVLVSDTTSHTTFPLTPGVMYPLAFKSITAVSAGTVKAYA
jgi:hypothetical protein